LAANFASHRTLLSRLSAAVVMVTTSALVGGVAHAVPPMAADPDSHAAGDTIVVRWNEKVLDSIRNSTLGPPMVARAAAIIHTCIYDAWAAYDPFAAGTRFGDDLRRPFWEWTNANKTEAISYAAHRAAVDLFPNRKPQLDAFMSSLGYNPNLQPSNPNSPAGIGVRACAAVLDYRHNDGSNQLGNLHPGPYSDWTGYQPVNQPMVVANPINPATVVNPNKWQPLTYPDKNGNIVTPSYLGAHWGNVRPFAMTSGSQHRSSTPPAQYGTNKYVQQANEVIALSANLTDRQKAIAEYWADGPNSEQPPGHWQLFAQFVSRRDGHNIDRDAKMFFALTNAVLDASIAAWDDKRAFDYVRPITAIRYLKRGQQISAWAGPGQGTRLIDGGTWKPYQATWFPTPPFAEYVSGHSAFSAAAAEVLKRFTGSDTFGYSATFPAGASNVEPGIAPATDIVMSWPTFSVAADEAGISRRYGGIHFVQGDLDGRSLGRTVGTQVWIKAIYCFYGSC
jgi:hypothetical protein